MKSLITLAIALIATQSTVAQDKHETNHSVQFSFGNYWVPNAENYNSSFFEPLVDIFALKYRYEITKKLATSISYAHWYRIDLLGSFQTVRNNGYTEPFPPPPFPQGGHKGMALSRFNYQFLDFTLSYSFLSQSNHTISASAGPSRAWGKNIQVVRFYKHPGYEDLLIESEIVGANYWGGVGGLAYDYRMSKHFSAGAFGNVRIYNGLHAQPEVGLNVSYHFRAFKPPAKAGI